MKKVCASSLAGIMVGIALFCAEGLPASQYEQGKELFVDNCVVCHGKDGKGDGPGAIAFNPKPANFTDPKFWQGDVEKKIADTIRNGHAPMPAFDLTPDQIKAVIDYLKQEFKK